MKTLAHYFVLLLSGVLFSIGLGIGGMTEPIKILGFLSIFGEWKPALLFVMIGAVGVYSSVFHIIVKNKRPLFSKSFHLPTSKVIDKRLIVGAMIFGAGWGIGGLCPGPAIVGLISLSTYSWVFFIPMIIGMILGKSSFGEKFLSQGE